jgi:hypothetical protein
MPLSVFNARRTVKRSQRSRGSCALALAAVLVGGRAAAQTTPEPEVARFEFRAPEGCGSAEDFTARVAKRSARIKLITQGSAPRSLAVEIQPADAAGVLRGRVTVVEPDGATRARQLKASTCEEAIDGLSLIATVTLDPGALMAEPVEPEPAKPLAEPAPEPPKPPKKPQSIPRRAEPIELYRFALGVGGAALLEVAPEPAFGGQLSAMFEMNPGHPLSPAWRLSLVHAQRRGVAEPTGEANFAYTLPTLEVCPVRLGPKVFGIRPCGFVTAGTLKAWGSEVFQEQERLRFFGAAGPALLVLLRLSKSVEIIADARAGFAFSKDQFAFDGEVFFTTPALGFSSAAGVSVGFP